MIIENKSDKDLRINLMANTSTEEPDTAVIKIASKSKVDDKGFPTDFMEIIILDKQPISREEMLRVANAMVKYGGSFVEDLGKALLQADEQNQQKIKTAFPEYWDRYNKVGGKSE